MPSFTESEEPKPSILQVELAPAASPKPAPPTPVAAPQAEPEPVKPRIEPKPVSVPKPEPKPIPQPVIKSPSKPVEQITPTPTETPVPATVTESPAPYAPEVMAAPAPVVTAPPPAPTPPPEPVGPSQQDLEAARNLYGSLLSRAIAKYKQYPKIAQMRGWEGEVLLEVHCDEKGQVISTEIKKSSGHKVLDDQAIAMVQKAAPLPQPPEILRSSKKLVILVPVPFTLEAS